MLGPNTRAWSVEEIEAFEESRPIAGPSPRGAAKAAIGPPAKDRQRKAAATTGQNGRRTRRADGR